VRLYINVHLQAVLLLASYTATRPTAGVPHVMNAVNTCWRWRQYITSSWRYNCAKRCLYGRALV